MTWDRLIPFSSATGEMLHYPGYVYGSAGPHWSPAQEFDATLKFVSVGRGRSSVVVTMVDEHGKNWPVSLIEFARIIPRLKEGTVSARWAQYKQGANFFIKPIEVHE